MMPTYKVTYEIELTAPAPEHAAREFQSIWDDEEHLPPEVTVKDLASGEEMMFDETNPATTFPCGFQTLQGETHEKRLHA
jgi:hypothetical protein